MTTVLQHVQDFCAKQNLPSPSALVGSTEKSVAQFRGLLLDLSRELLEFRWEQQKIRKTWTSVAGQDQGALEDIFGAGYLSLVPGSGWNNTRRMRIYGPLADQIWAALQVLPNAGPEFQCWVSGGHLYVSPAFVAGETLSFIYQTKYGVQASDGTAKERITADDDVLLFPDNVVFRGLEYKWKKQKGEAGWEDDYNVFIGLVAKNLVKDGAPTLTMSPNRRGPQPGIVIPAGNWNV